MASFNKVILMGNLTRDPEVRYTPSGTAVSEVGLAVNRTWFDKQSNQRKEEVTFVDVTLWGRQAEVAGEYLTKGRGVLIEGRLQLDQWDDKDTGQKRSKLRVVGENMTMLPGRGDSGSQRGGGSDVNSASTGGGASADGLAPGSPSSFGGDFETGGGGAPPDDDVPF
ncbi:MAG: single-stranded DNA-binding protein [Planctomycetota bacterium]|nr:single-stranded DNA-binding protein [Planctomycetota bacterium]